MQLLRGNFIMKGKNPLMFNSTNSSEYRVFQWSAEHRKHNSSEKYAHLGGTKVDYNGDFTKKRERKEQSGCIPTFKYT